MLQWGEWDFFFSKKLPRLGICALCSLSIFTVLHQLHPNSLTEHQAHVFPCSNFPYRYFPGTKSANEKAVFPVVLSLPILPRLKEESFSGSSWKRRKKKKGAGNWTGRTENLEGRKGKLEDIPSLSSLPVGTELNKPKS